MGKRRQKYQKRRKETTHLHQLPPMDPEEQIATIGFLVERLADDPRLKVIVIHDDGTKGLALLPDDDRNALDKQLPEAKGKDLVMMTDVQARQFGVI